MISKVTGMVSVARTVHLGHTVRWECASHPVRDPARFPKQAFDSDDVPVVRRRTDSERALTSVPSRVTRAGCGAMGREHQRTGSGAEPRTIRHVLPKVLGHLRRRRLLVLAINFDVNHGHLRRHIRRASSFSSSMRVSRTTTYTTSAR